HSPFNFHFLNLQTCPAAEISALAAEAATAPEAVPSPAPQSARRAAASAAATQLAREPALLPPPRSRAATSKADARDATRLYSFPS
ncbi:hypothetical protein PFISCL1PPCAC_13959, partial [Pristionchus fissidentatus]